jgi:hypothetical protein
MLPERVIGCGMGDGLEMLGDFYVLIIWVSPKGLMFLIAQGL